MCPMKSSKISSKVIPLSKIFVRSTLNIFYQCRHEQTKATHLPRLTLSSPPSPAGSPLGPLSLVLLQHWRRVQEKRCEDLESDLLFMPAALCPASLLLPVISLSLPGCPEKRPCLVRFVIICSIKMKENLSLISISHHVRCAISCL